jgi:nucleotide-binding universal stress UspA family protein
VIETRFTDDELVLVVSRAPALWNTEVVTGRGSAVFTNILVGLDGSQSSQRALEQAIDLTRSGGAKLTLMTVAPPVATLVTLGGMSIEAMSAELNKWAKNVLDEAARTVPPEITAERVQGSGHVGPEILKELKRGGYDLIVLGTRGRGRTQEGLLGSVNGYIHFHAHIPLLSVPDKADD